MNPSKTCAYCGRANGAQATQCSECGTSEFIDETTVIRETPAPSMSGPRISPVRVASLALLVLAALYWLTAISNVIVGRLDPDEIGQGHSWHWYWAALRNFVVAALCFAARQMMRKGTPVLCGGAAFLLAIALFMTVWTWLAARSAGRNPLPWIEVLIVWPALLYGAAVAYKATIGGHPRPLH